jgi:Protein of unknown function (DUF1559)
MPLAGCGPSQEDLMARAARRVRPKDPEEEPKNSPPPAAEVVKPAVSDGPAVAEPIADASLAELSIKPIEERVPATPLTETQRRRMALENITKLANVLVKYSAKNRQYPRSYSFNQSKIPTLSWRVEILPYLGYEDLYKKFDFSVPWNVEPNLSLLKYIPPEFVSPERFDTKTNYLLPAHKSYMFGENRNPMLSTVEDGIENTIMLVEVNDSAAIEWTQPTDFVPVDRLHLSKELGGLRGDGTFAAWANGWVTLLAGGLKDVELSNAFTHQSGDGQLAGLVHRAITIEQVSEASLAKAESEPTESTAAQTAPVMNTPPRQPEAEIVREVVPIAAVIADAQEKLRNLYAEQIQDAQEDKDKTKLAKVLLKEALVMDGDPAGAYALQTAALRLAADAADATTLIDGIDQRVGRFEVDAYNENAVWILAFGQSAAQRVADTVDGKVLMRRAVRTIYAGIDDNDFVRAADVARITFRYTGQERGEKIPKLFNRLQTLTLSASREYEKAREHLIAFREDPAKIDAGAAFGRFLCFIKGDWTAGLPLIAEGTNEDLRDLSKRDLKGAADYYNQIALGDSWWDMSERAKAGVYKQAARDRAVHWYKMAYEVVPESLDRLHVKSRLDEADSEEGSSPIAVCQKLADELGVDLSESLAAIAHVGQERRKQRDNDADDDDD